MFRSFPFKVLWTGLITWAIPLVISFAFYTRDGRLQVPLGTFKAVMFIVGTAVAMGMLALLYRGGPPAPHAGWILGIAWLAINIVLDLAVLVAGFGMGAATYFATVGLGYLAIPMMTVSVDAIVHRAR